MRRPRRLCQGAAGSGRVPARVLGGRQHSRSLPCASDGTRARVVAAARERGVHPGYAGRDYAGLDDALLVCVTEKRTPADIDRLVDVLTEVAR